MTLFKQMCHVALHFKVKFQNKNIKINLFKEISHVLIIGALQIYKLITEINLHFSKYKYLNCKISHAMIIRVHKRLH